MNQVQTESNKYNDNIDRTVATQSTIMTKNHAKRQNYIQAMFSYPYQFNLVGVVILHHQKL